MYGTRSVLSIDDLKDDDVSRLFYCARSMQADSVCMEHKHSRAVLMTAFFEPSTRTRLSFEMAALRMGMRVTSFSASSSSMSKGESTEETLLNLAALSPDILVVRQSEQLSHEKLRFPGVAILSGGDGINEHPTQALLDCFTLLNHFRADDLRKRRILIIGDLAHSRVAHSNIKLMRRLGAEITLLAPDMFHLIGDHGQASSISRFQDAKGQFDAVMCLRIQKERMSLGCGLSDEEFFSAYGLTKERLRGLGKNCVVMHPGPMNVGVEIEASVAYGGQSLITEQVKNGVFVRAGLIDLVLKEKAGA